MTGIKLPLCEFAVNHAWNASTDEYAFFLNNGEHPVTPATVDASGVGSPSAFVSSDFPAVKGFFGKYAESDAKH